MHKVFGKLASAAEWFAGFVREVNRGIAVGRGYVPVGGNVRGVRRAFPVHRCANSGIRLARKEARTQRRSF